MCQSEVYSISSIRFAIPQKKKDNTAYGSQNIRNEHNMNKKNDSS